MSNDGVFGGWYRTHLGEPLEPDHVNGYWAFLFGALLALIGLVLFLVASTFDRGTDDFWLFRRVAFTLALVAGPIVVLSIVYLLPLQARAVWLAILGLLLCVGAVIAFNVFYPSDWNWGSGDMSAVVMGGYGLGAAIQILTVFLYPLVSSDTAQPAAPADGSEEPAAGADVAAADTSKATFQLYTDRADEHRWRLVHDNGNVIADSGEGYASRQKARQGMASVKKNASGADEEVLQRVPEDAPLEATEAATGEGGDVGSEDGDADDAGGAETAEPATAESEDASAFEFGTTEDRGDGASGAADGGDVGEGDTSEGDPESNASFEVYEDSAGEYRWRLVHDNGNVIADPGEGYSRRSAVNEAVERIRRVAGDADTLEYEPAGFELYADAADEWRWRLRHRNGRILADSGEGYTSRRNARDGIESVREHVDDAEHFEVYEDQGGEYRWRLLASNGELIADSGQGYSRRGRAEEAVERVAEYAPAADTLDYDPAAYEVFQDNADEWRWRLRHRNGRILADSGEGYASKQKARQGMRSVMANAPGADIVEEE